MYIGERGNAHPLPGLRVVDPACAAHIGSDLQDDNSQTSPVGVSGCIYRELGSYFDLSPSFEPGKVWSRVANVTITLRSKTKIYIYIRVA